MTEPETEATLKDLVEKYIELRDARDAMKKKFQEDSAPLLDIMGRIEGLVLRKFEELGVESCRTAGGTAYKSARRSVGVADWDSTLDYIKSKGLWSMLERRVSKNAVEEFVAEHDELPPGLNWREESVVNIRRS